MIPADSSRGLSDGGSGVGKYLLPAMIPDYAQVPAVYVETDGSMC
ncbi:hypothetical protein ACTNDG_09315 [Clostridium sp. HCP1S3_B4]